MTVHITIRGKVQGVFYRASAQEKAAELGLRGWVKNTDEGNVEAVVSGADEQVRTFIHWCRQGPPRSLVTGVDISPYHGPDSFTGFQIIRG